MHPTKPKLPGLLVLILLGSVAAFGWIPPSGPRHRPPGPLLAAEQGARDKAAAKPGPAPARSEGPDPVELFRKALAQPVRDPGNQEEIRYRKTTLEKQAKAVKRLDQIARVLALQEWRHMDREEQIAAVDRSIRKELVDSFATGVSQALDKGNTETRLAILTMLGDMGTRVHGDTDGVALATTLAPNLISLLRREPVGPVAEVAAWTLGKINPEPQAAAAALAKLLASKNDPVRRAAARGLASLPKVTLALMKAARMPNSITVSRESALKVGLQALPAAAPGFKDSDAVVRRACLETMQTAAVLLEELVGEPSQGLDFPPAGRKPSDEEKELMAEYRKDVEKERALVLPLARSLSEQIPAVARAVVADDGQVSLQAAGTLEYLASARATLLRKAASVPLIEGADEKTLREDPLRDGLRNAVPFAAKALTRPEVRSRLAAIYFLELMGSDGAAAIPALAQAAGDSDPFVRWGVARALGRMAPAGVATAVPALVRLLADDNRDARIAAAAALEKFGPAARPAVPALGRAAASKDQATRIWAITALGAIGADAKEALPALVDALSAPQPEARAAAAGSLGKLGAAARTATDALRKALNDPNADVRQAAATALLAVN